MTNIKLRLNLTFVTMNLDNEFQRLSEYVDLKWISTFFGHHPAFTVFSRGNNLIALAYVLTLPGHSGGHRLKAVFQIIDAGYIIDTNQVSGCLGLSRPLNSECRPRTGGVERGRT